MREGVRRGGAGLDDKLNSLALLAATLFLGGLMVILLAARNLRGSEKDGSGEFKCDSVERRPTNDKWLIEGPCEDWRCKAQCHFASLGQPHRCPRGRKIG